jgi:type IV fimbrial biogenesis protein FimT
MLVTSRGTTLPELLVAIMLLGVVAAVAVPNFVGIIERQRATLLADQFAATLSAARARAITERRPVMIVPLHGAWHMGWQLCVDLDNNEHCDSGDQVFQQMTSVPSGGALQWNSSVTANDIRFAPVGYSRRKTGGFVAGTMRINVGTTVRLVTLSAQGRVRICTPASDSACSASP